MNPLFRIDLSISDSLKTVRKSVLIYETIIDTAKGIGNFFNALSPFLIGFFIAYLLNPAIKAIEYQIFDRICHIPSRNIREILAMLVTYLLVIGLIIASFVFLIPQIGESITDLLNRFLYG